MRLGSRNVAPGYIGVETGISDEIARLDPAFSAAQRLLAAALRPASRFASLAGLRQGFCAILNGQFAQIVATHLRTSPGWWPQQSMQRRRIACNGDIG